MSHIVFPRTWTLCKCMIDIRTALVSNVTIYISRIHTHANNNTYTFAAVNMPLACEHMYFPRTWTLWWCMLSAIIGPLYIFRERGHFARVLDPLYIFHVREHFACVHVIRQSASTPYIFSTNVDILRACMLSGSQHRPLSIFHVREHFACVHVIRQPASTPIYFPRT